MLRKVVQIDEAKCDGCGECIDACAEGAIALVGGKARLVSDVYCDGLGACLGDCPQGAITVIEREAEGFDESAVAQHLTRLGRPLPPPDAHAAHASATPVARLGEGHPAAHLASHPAAHAASHTGCPGSAARELKRPGLAVVRDGPGPSLPQAPRQGGSTLSHWPVQLMLVPPHAPWLKGADLLVAADCVPFAYAGFHADLLAGKKLVIACPKLDDNRANTEKLAALCAQGRPASITVVRMEVPCCGGLSMAARQAVAASGLDIPVKDVVVGVDGALRTGN